MNNFFLLSDFPKVLDNCSGNFLFKILSHCLQIFCSVKHLMGQPFCTKNTRLPHVYTGFTLWLSRWFALERLHMSGLCVDMTLVHSYTHPTSTGNLFFFFKNLPKFPLNYCSSQKKSFWTLSVNWILYIFIMEHL